MLAECTLRQVVAALQAFCLVLGDSVAVADVMLTRMNVADSTKWNKAAGNSATSNKLSNGFAICNRTP